MPPSSATSSSALRARTTSRVLQAQFHGISGHGLEQFRQAEKVETILTPSEYKTGTVIYPYSKAKDSTAG